MHLNVDGVGPCAIDQDFAFAGYTDLGGGRCTWGWNSGTFGIDNNNGVWTFRFVSSSVSIPAPSCVGGAISGSGSFVLPGPGPCAGNTVQYSF